MKYTALVTRPDYPSYVYYCVEDIVDYLDKQEEYEKMEPVPEAPCYAYLAMIYSRALAGMSYRALAKAGKEIIHNGRAYRELWEAHLHHKQKDWYDFWFDDEVD